VRESIAIMALVSMSLIRIDANVIVDTKAHCAIVRSIRVPISFAITEAAVTFSRIRNRPVNVRRAIEGRIAMNPMVGRIDRQ
jgi:hypothetical protein